MVAPHKRPTTQPGRKMAPALWVAPVKPPRSVARRLFGMTTKTSGTSLRASPEGVKHRDVLNKLLSSLLDWRFYRRNRRVKETLTDPSSKVDIHYALYRFRPPESPTGSPSVACAYIPEPQALSATARTRVPARSLRRSADSAPTTRVPAATRAGAAIMRQLSRPRLEMR